jgi:HlyD family secretion protein
MKKSSPLPIAIVILLLVAVAASGIWYASRPAPDVFQGQMEARETDIAPKVPGRIAQVMVREGDKVEAGTLLVKIDSPEVNAKLAQATGARDAATALENKAKAGARPEEVRMAMLNWQRAQAAADLAEKSFRRVEGLAKEGLVADQKRDEAMTNYQAARDAAAAAKAQYEMAKAGARAEDKAAAAAQVRQVSGVVAEVEAARAETELKSPVAGEVAKVYAKAGELSPQGVAVVSVVDLNDQWAVFNVREDKLSRFANGKEFDAVIPALDNRKVRMKVYYTAALPDFATWRATRSNQGFDARTFEVRARPLSPVDGARPGMSVIVE